MSEHKQRQLEEDISYCANVQAYFRKKFKFNMFLFSFLLPLEIWITLFFMWKNDPTNLNMTLVFFYILSMFVLFKDTIRFLKPIIWDYYTEGKVSIIIFMIVPYLFYFILNLIINNSYKDFMISSLTGIIIFSIIIYFEITRKNLKRKGFIKTLGYITECPKRFLGYKYDAKEYFARKIRLEEELKRLNDLKVAKNVHKIIEGS